VSAANHDDHGVDEHDDGDVDDVGFDADQPTVDHVGSWSQVKRLERSEAYLVVLAGSRVGEIVRVDQDVVIGRGPKASFRINDASVSKSHLRLSRNADGNIVAKDLGSRNGTYVNGQSVVEAELGDGDKIGLGSTTILKLSLADTVEESFRQRMYEAAVRDPLTGLHNRRHLVERINAEFCFATRHHSSLSVLMLDIDHFKRLNDVHGHLVGDEVLRGLGELLQDQLRKEDVAARYGGEEFVIVCRGVPPSQAATLAERIREKVAQGRLSATVPDLAVTISAGVCGVPGAVVREVHDLIDGADKALYAAKRDGRNRVRLCLQP